MTVSVRNSGSDGKGKNETEAKGKGGPSLGNSGGELVATSSEQPSRTAQT